MPPIELSWTAKKMRMYSSPLLSKMDHEKEEESEGAADEDEGD